MKPDDLDAFYARLRALIARLQASGLSTSAYRVSEAMRSNYMLGELLGAVGEELSRLDAEGEAAKVGEQAEVGELIAFCKEFWR